MPWKNLMYHTTLTEILTKNGESPADSIVCGENILFLTSHTGLNPRSKSGYERKARVIKEIEKLPQIGDNYDGRKVIAINEIGMDCEQPFDDNFNYDLYEIVCEDEDVNIVEWYVCVRKES